MPPRDTQRENTLRSIALFEAAKGAIVLLAGLGLATVIHDEAHLIERLVAHLHLNPAKGSSTTFLNLAHDLANIRLWMLAAGAAAYALVRFIEAYGLWHGKRWATWFAAMSGAIYLPFEGREIAVTHSWIALAALLLNGLVVALMLKELRRPAKVS